MKPSILRLLLGISVLFNLGVLAALGWQQLSHGSFNDTGEPLLARELELDEQQRQRWQQIEASFLVELQQSTAAIQQQHRSEEHTSELQSRENLVCRLLLEKKKNST